MKYKVFIFDIDNTLTSSRDWQFVPSAVAALKELRSRGYTVVISSGRTPGLAVMLAEAGIEYDYFVGANGHMVADGKRNVLWAKYFDSDLCERIERYVREHDLGFFWKLTEGPHVIVSNETIERIFSVYHVSSVEKPQPFMTFGGAMVTEPEKERMFFEEFKQEIDSVNGGALIYDILIKGVSKKDGIRELCRILNVSREECMAFGDSANDVEMLEYAGLGIAMGDGRAACRNAADYVTAETYNDGIEKALKYFGIL